MPRQYYPNFPDIAQQKSRVNIEQKNKIVRNNTMEFTWILVLRTISYRNKICFKIFRKNILLMISSDINLTGSCPNA